MQIVKVISDGACDLPMEMLSEYGIDIVPFYLSLDGRIVRDGPEWPAERIYEFVDKTGVLPGTIACSVEDFKSAFKKWTDLGLEVVCITISSEMSGSYQNAMIAAGEFKGVSVLDSRNLTTGQGHLAVNAAIMAKEGMDSEKILKEITPMREKLNSSFILDNLRYMHNGGRCTSVELLGANLLRIKPEITVENGMMKVGRKFRGSLEKVLCEYVDARLTNTPPTRKERIFITHTGCSGEIVSMVRKRIESHVHFDKIIETHASGLVVSHSGPSTLGILYM